MSVRPRVVVASPDRAEVALLADWLHAEGLEPVPVRSLPGAIEEVQSRSFDVLIADARFAFEGQLHALARTHNARAPLVVIGGTDRVDRAGTFRIGRPVDQTLFLCHVAMAIVEGRPARRSVRKRISHFDGLVEGTEVFVIDVSNDGMRLEIPRRRLAPPPQFTIRIPLVGIALPVRRVWMSGSSPESADVSWCGVELVTAPARAIQNWRAFVDAIPAR